MHPLLHLQTELPPLERPVLLVALEGFIDAGGVAGTAAMFLRHRWKSELVATFDRDDLIDYRARRPTVVVDSGKLRRVEWPDIELMGATVGGPHDALLLLGPEPDMRWAAFCDAVVAVSRQAGVEAAIGLGAYPAAAPHTRPVRIMRATNLVAGDLVPEAGDIVGYTGPVGAGTVLQAALGDAGIPAVGLWAEVPHYISGSPNPGGALALVRCVAAAMHTEVETTELEAAAKLHREQVDEAVAEHPEAGEMVQALERHVDSGGADGELPSGDDLAAEIERFLRTQSD
ncbi:filament polymerization regulator ParJ [soil metagenome]|jgi:proteasome assembly chaperone (PAC2) family protein|nr:PAC2 family protein [Euzebyaceae bacterium]